MNVLEKIFNFNKRDLKNLRKIASQVDDLKDDMTRLADSDFKKKTDEYRAQFKELENRQDEDKLMDKILPEAFALVREASKRTLGLEPFLVQIMGGIALHRGDIAEMKTGEGKTLTAAMPVYLNALSGRGVHVITVNEYLSSTQSEEMSKLYNFLGLSVGLNLNEKNSEEKREAYLSDVTYTTNNELGFDYLRDNMVVYKKDRVQRELNYAIVDEVDSILIDEARTPLIISGKADSTSTNYVSANSFVKTLKLEEDFTFDEKTKNIQLTETGVEKAENWFELDNLYDVKNVNLIHHINQALRANKAMTRDVDYVIEDNKVVIVDQFTGRKMPGRRFSDGLHQALEAKEGLDIQNESRTMASITFQNFFRQYYKLSGMTGTAKTEEEEFVNIYNMNVISIPTNVPVARIDNPDKIYATKDMKFKAVLKDVEERHRRGQPILIGTVAVETSEYISNILRKKGIRHNVLNAKNHASEAEIILDAGKKGAVTIATNMAGRGTDIKLGPGVKELGGLYVIGTERHESRRIDDQLRGRSGRQGDVGESSFYLSLEDDLMRRFGSERIQKMMERLGMGGEELSSKVITRSVESAQKRVEGNNFDARKRLLQFDDVQRQQRDVIYRERNEILDNEDINDSLMGMIEGAVDRLVDYHIIEDEDNRDYEAFIKQAEEYFIHEGALEVSDIQRLEKDEVRKILLDKINDELEAKEKQLGTERMRMFESMIMLKTIDKKWIEHIDAMNQLRTGIHLRSYAQTNPLQEYQREGLQMFEELLTSIEDDTAKFVLKTKIRQEDEIKREEVVDKSTLQAGNTAGATSQKKPVRRKPMINEIKIGRNDPCPCGSGEKYKNCHGSNA